MKLNFHSFVDVITNSSTVVYMMLTGSTEERIIEFINTILEMGDSDKKFDDLFTIEEVPDPEYEEEWIEDKFNDRYNEVLDELLKQEGREFKGTRYQPSNNYYGREDTAEYQRWEASIKDLENKVSDLIDEKLKAELEELKANGDLSWCRDTNEYMCRDRTTLMMTPKDESKEAIDVLELLTSMLDADGYRDG